MELTAQEIATHLGGEVEGNPELKISGFARIEQGAPGTLCFLANPKYEEWLYKTKASLVIINRTFKLTQKVPYTVVWVDDAYRGIAAMLDLYAAANAVQRRGREYPSRVSWRAKVGKGCYIGAFSYIARGAKIGNNVKIFPHVYVGDGATVGDNSILYSGAKIYPGCHVGKNCILHSGAVVGSDGFGFAPDAEKNYKKIPQIGNVTLGDDVELGANACIDRATMGSTVLHQGVKLDNLVHIAHNVEVGKNTVMAAGTGIAGSTKIGERCMFGGHVGVIGHLNIGNDVILGAKCGASGDIPNGEAQGGWPGMPAGLFRRTTILIRRLPELFAQVGAVEKELKAMKEK